MTHTYQTMTPIHRSLMLAARRRHKDIYPLPKFPTFPECFTAAYGKLYFWYNTSDNSTHLVHSEMAKENDSKCKLHNPCAPCLKDGKFNEDKICLTEPCMV